MYFNELNLEPRLQLGIEDRGYQELTSVQEKTLAHSLERSDVAVQSQTGTGKTAAFLITMFERMLREKSRRKNIGLIIVPTRELAVQIEEEANLLNRHIGFYIGSLFGGVGRAGQINRLRRGLDMVVGTPGRLLDLGTTGDLNLKEVGILVIDEADRLLDMGFLPDLKKLLKKMPPRHLRQTMFFSATLNRASQKITAEHMNDPVSITVTPDQVTVEAISQEIYHVKSHVKLNLMLGLLKEHSPRSVLIFTNMRHSAFKLAKKLELNGFKCRHLTGDLPQSRRLQIIEGFRSREFGILVATDVAARGLQIDDLDMVINYDVPQDCENYVHRIGRTARAGATGKAITFASEGTFGHQIEIENFIGMKIPEKEADIEMYALDLSEGKRVGSGGKKRGGGSNNGRDRSGMKYQNKNKSRNKHKERSKHEAGTKSKDRFKEKDQSNNTRNKRRSRRSQGDRSAAAPPA
jgi:ATP-dependent RNA helicase RhlB